MKERALHFLVSNRNIAWGAVVVTGVSTVTGNVISSVVGFTCGFFLVKLVDYILK